MGFSGIKPKLGRSYDFYQRLSVNWTTFGGGSSDGYGPDMIIPFTTQGVLVLNEETNTSKIIEYSLNGKDVHGAMYPGTPTQGFVFDFRVMSIIWFRVQPGSTTPATVSLQAWATQ